MQCHQETGRAEATLQRMVLVKALLQGGKLAIRGRQPLDGGDLLPIGLHRQHQAGTHWLPADRDGAGAADAMFAAKMGTRQAELVPQEIRKSRPRRHFRADRLAIDGEIYRAHGCHPAAAWESARESMVSSNARRYSALAWG